MELYREVLKESLGSIPSRESLDLERRILVRVVMSEMFLEKGPIMVLIGFSSHSSFSIT